MFQTPSKYGKIAVFIAVISAAGDFLVTSILGFLYKDYNSLTDSQSDLGTFNSPVALYMNTWEVLLGLLLLACVYCLYKAGFSKTSLQKLSLWLLALYGMGEGIGSGLFPFNHVNHQLTTTGWFHSIFSGIGITAMVILSFVLPVLFSRKKFRQLHKAFLWYAIIGILFILLCLLSRVDFLRFVGLWQRLYLAAYYLMLITLTLHLYRSTQKSVV